MDNSLSLREAAEKRTALGLKRWKVEQISFILGNREELEKESSDVEALIKAIEESPKINWNLRTHALTTGGCLTGCSVR